MAELVFEVTQELGRSYARAFKQLQLLRTLRIRLQPNEPKQSLPIEPLSGRAPALQRIPPNIVSDKAQPAPKSVPVEPLGDRAEPQATGPARDTIHLPTYK